MIPLRLLHDNCVGCAARLLMKQLAIRLSHQKTIAKSLVIAVLISTVSSLLACLLVLVSQANRNGLCVSLA
jgi:hypothetical protein